MMDKKKLFTWLYVIMILVVIATCVFLVVWIKGESVSCLADPIQYYANKTNQLCFCNDGLGWARG